MANTDSQKVLVTGATGFIGGHLARRLVEDGCQVTCLVRSNPAAGFDGCALVKGDVLDPRSLERALETSGAQVVFHLAGVVRAVDPSAFMKVNAGGVGAVATACGRRFSPPTLVVVSSLAAAGPSRDGRPRVEGDPPMPVSAYGRSKRAGEEEAAKHAGTLPITVVRPPIVFGPGDRGVLEIFRPIWRSGIHVVPGRGENQLSLAYVEDLVDCLVLAALRGERLPSSPMPGQGIYLASFDEWPSHAELGTWIAAAMDRKRPRVVRLPQGVMRCAGMLGDLTSKISGRPGWVNSDKISEALAGSWICSAAKARAQLRWGPGKTLAERLRETADWYRREKWL